MRHGLKQATALILGLAIVTLVGSASAQTKAANVDGTWKGGTARGDDSVTLVLKQEGSNVTGTVSGLGAGVDGPVTGMVDGNTIRLKSGFGGKSPLLNVKGDQITGTVAAGALTLTRAKK
jgi:hypothetical protein